MYVVDELTGALQLLVSDGLSDEFLENASHYAPESFNAQVVMQGKSVHIDFQAADLPLDDVATREGLRATPIFPMLHNGLVIACLNVASRSFSKLPPSKRNELALIVSMVVSSIAKAREAKILQETAAQLAQARALAHLGSWSLDPRTGRITGSDWPTRSHRS